MMGDGKHLIIDGYTRRPLGEPDIRAFLWDMLGREYLDMTLIAGPEVHPVPGGWSGIVVIAESHIKAESHGRAVLLDVFSCRPFDPERVISYCRDRWGLEVVRQHELKRGWANRAEKESTGWQHITYDGESDTVYLDGAKYG